MLVNSSLVLGQAAACGETSALAGDNHPPIDRAAEGLNEHSFAPSLLLFLLVPIPTLPSPFGTAHTP